MTCTISYTLEEINIISLETLNISMACFSHMNKKSTKPSDKNAKKYLDAGVNYFDDENKNKFGLNL